MNSFDKIISICKWEEPFLLELGCDKERIEYIPNSIPDEFFETEKKEGEGIFFIGRISPVKNLEVLELALSELKMTANAIGPIEKDYNPKFKSIKIKDPIYNLKEKIEEIDTYEIMVLPSEREAFPFVVLEAMARGKIVIASKTKGAEELITDCKNGFLFEIGNSKELQSILDAVKKMSKEGKDKIKEEAIKTTEKFKSSDMIKKWENLFK
jgi:glycosyltransferase involved in cell wall biosynthesis